MVARKSNEAAPVEETKAEETKSTTRRQIALAQFRPEKDWVAKTLLVEGAARRVSLARVFGIAMKIERRPMQLPDGTPTETLVCVGAFRCENYATGETGDSRNVVFPAGYAQALESLFKDGNPLELDVDIDIEANDKGATTWIVVPRIGGEDMNYLDGLAGSRERPETAAPLTQAAESVQSATDQAAAPSAA